LKIFWFGIGRKVEEYFKCTEKGKCSVSVEKIPYRA
jgi:hypothetical protein